MKHDGNALVTDIFDAIDEAFTPPKGGERLAARWSTISRPASLALAVIVFITIAAR
jgi:hypothetical protein